MTTMDSVAESRAVRNALADASRAIRAALGDSTWDHDDVVDVLDAIWTAWARRGDAMRAIDPDCYSTHKGDEQ